MSILLDSTLVSESPAFDFEMREEVAPHLTIWREAAGAFWSVEQGHSLFWPPGGASDDASTLQSEPTEIWYRQGVMELEKSVLDAMDEWSVDPQSSWTGSLDALLSVGRTMGLNALLYP